MVNAKENMSDSLNFNPKSRLNRQWKNLYNRICQNNLKKKRIKPITLVKKAMRTLQFVRLPRNYLYEALEHKFIKAVLNRIRQFLR